MSLEFVVTGMVCSGCSETVERVVSELAGVSSQSVNHETGAASVEHDGSVEPATIYEAIRGSGFGVRACGNEHCVCPNCNCVVCGCAPGSPCNCS